MAQTAKRFVEWSGADPNNSATGPLSCRIHVPLVTGLALAFDELVPCGKNRGAGLSLAVNTTSPCPGEVFVKVTRTAWEASGATLIDARPSLTDDGHGGFNAAD